MPILPEYSLAGRVAILATSGGEEAPVLAQVLAEAGSAVFVLARRRASLEAVLEALRKTPPLTPPYQGRDGGVSHGGVVAEVATASGLAEAMEAFDRRHGRVDILVNDARSPFARPFTDITPEEWDTVQARNVRATFLLCQEVGRRMIQQQYGRIVNVLSGLAERGMINSAAFSASQAAVLSLTRSLAVEWGRYNIRVNALGTGWFTAEDISLEVQQRELLVRYIPLRRKGHPRDIGPLLVYLCSEACDYSTGQPVYVDGGLNARP